MTTWYCVSLLLAGGRQSFVADPRAVKSWSQEHARIVRKVPRSHWHVCILKHVGAISTSDLPSAATQKASPEATRQLAWHAPFALPDNTAPKRHQRHRMWSHPRLCRPTPGPDCGLAREPVERYNEVSVAKHGPHGANYAPVVLGFAERGAHRNGPACAPRLQWKSRTLGH